MTAGFVRQFVDTLDAAASQQDGLADAIEALEAEPASEFSRCLNAFCLEVTASLRAADVPGWKIVPDSEFPFGAAVLARCGHYLNAEQEAEFSTALLAQVLFRADAQALEQVNLALRSGNVLPEPLAVKDVAEVARTVTAGVAQSYGLPADRASVDGAGDADDYAEPSDFERIVGHAARNWAELPAEIRGTDVLGSASLVRLAVGRGADQRISRWLQATGLNMIDFARVQATEQLADLAIAGVPATREAVDVWNAARWLSTLGDQALSTDRIILASLARPSSHLASHLVGLFGPAVNLPLLYLRTALPPGISQHEAQWLIAQGDANVRPGPSAAAGDLCSIRIARLWAEAEYQPGFDAASRLRAYLEHNEPNRDFPVPDYSFLTGDALGVVRLLRRAYRSQQGKPSNFGQLFELLRPAARRPDGEECWSYERYQTLTGSDLDAAYVARRQLAACQLGALGLRALARIGPSSHRIGELLDRAPDVAVDAVSVAHCLESGVYPYPPHPVGDTVRLIIGGGNGRYVLAVVARHAREYVEFELSEQQAVSAWQAMRRPAVRGEWADVADAMRAATATIGLDRVVSVLDDADIEFTVVRPFDGFMVDQLIRSVATPRSVIHRVFGARAGTWAGDFALLRRAGGTPLVVDDPSDSLASASPEAIAIGDILDATRIGGRGVRRATVLRMLEATSARPPFIHFTGHGVSGLVGPNGEVTSGVLAASREAIGVASISGANMPRVLVASTCDVGATPPIARSAAWSTSAITHGASYSLAPGLPIDDTSALVFTILVAQRWSAGEHLEAAVAAISRLGRSPADLLAAWANAAPGMSIRLTGTNWIRERSSVDIAHCMGAFSLSSA